MNADLQNSFRVFIRASNGTKTPPSRFEDPAGTNSLEKWEAQLKETSYSFAGRRKLSRGD